ncbi:hypothetical protein BCR37DRAFT_389093 [Protomyces lactucae-debilis]|uniref:Cyclase-domain-containing protein n=1 Tax=Protomyces lactucae-debilis TaxID=2754530 RepID=A0A1Y2F4D8_PROLT|nr:uncharacterized protein BCR37DRAFT_389093 [Protomyces lactucae-debilis]ORY77805.1 hypothetical protein BCR37DRAFT_389093 [Protomyces lactucae-debilis]
MASDELVETIMRDVSFDELPTVAGNPKEPPYSAWVWGKDDTLGTLNYLTDARVRDAAASCIKTGKRVCLNWNLQHPTHPGFGRQAFQHEILAKPNRVVFDDTVHFNTQHSSQWDGHRHFGYQKEAVFYNGETMDDVLKGEKHEGCGMASWAQKGIAGRAVLIDVWAYIQDKPELQYDPWTTHGVSLSLIHDVAKAQGTTFQKGDILIFRTGYHTAYEKKTDDEILAKSKQIPPQFAGIKQDIKFAEWVYNNKFAAVAGDAPAFESWPGDLSAFGKLLHEVFLAGWGMPIGEMFYLERLSELCKQEGRWSFFVSSSPLNVPGGVATPPNIMAIL